MQCVGVLNTQATEGPTQHNTTEHTTISSTYWDVSCQIFQLSFWQKYAGANVHCLLHITYEVSGMLWEVEKKKEEEKEEEEDVMVM